MNAADKRLMLPFLREVSGCAVRPLSLKALSLLRRYAEKRKPLPPRKIEKKKERLIRRMVRAEVRAACVKRAAGLCECGCGCRAPYFDFERFTPEMDHFYGRARAESIETCWMLSCGHHEDKTDNYPSRAYWDDKFKAHCAKYGYPFKSRLIKEARRPQRLQRADSLMGSDPRGPAGASLTTGGAAAGPLKQEER